MPIHCDRCESVIDPEDRTRLHGEDFCLECAGPLMREQRDDALNEIQRVTFDAPDPVLEEWIRITLERLLETIEASGHNDYGVGAWMLATMARGFNLCSEELQDKFSAHPLPLVDEGKILDALIKRNLQERMIRNGWKIVGTGGGCTAWSKECNGYGVEVTDDSSSDLDPLVVGDEDSGWCFNIFPTIANRPGGENTIFGGTIIEERDGVGFVKYCDLDTERYPSAIASEERTLDPDGDQVEYLQTFLDYINDVTVDLPDPKQWYQAILEEAGFESESTGGGCTAWAKNIGGDVCVWIYGASTEDNHGHIMQALDDDNHGWGGEVAFGGGHEFHLFADMIGSELKFHSGVFEDIRPLPVIDFTVTHHYDAPRMLRLFIDYVIGAGQMFKGAKD